jgi:hypothetical protein
MGGGDTPSATIRRRQDMASRLACQQDVDQRTRSELVRPDLGPVAQLVLDMGVPHPRRLADEQVEHILRPRRPFSWSARHGTEPQPAREPGAHPDRRVPPMEPVVLASSWRWWCGRGRRRRQRLVCRHEAGGPSRRWPADRCPFGNGLAIGTRPSLTAIVLPAARRSLPSPGPRRRTSSPIRWHRPGSGGR